MTQSRTTPPSALWRLARAPGMPLAVAAVLIPLLVFGFLRGGLFVAHAHDDRTTHLHAVSPASAARLIAGEHCEDHRHDDGHVHAQGHEGDPSPDQSSGAACDHRSGGDAECDHAPDGVLVSLAQPKQLPPRSADVSKTLHQFAIPVVIAILPAPALDAPSFDRPDAGSAGSPRDFLSLHTRQRIVRTSHALLL